MANGHHDLRVAVAAEPAHHLTCCAGALAVVPDCLGEGVVGVGEMFQGGHIGTAAVTIDILSKCELQAVPVAGEELPQAAA